jgi:hypothetical protein
MGQHLEALARRRGVVERDDRRDVRARVAILLEVAPDGPARQQPARAFEQIEHLAAEALVLVAAAVARRARDVGSSSRPLPKTH